MEVVRIRRVLCAAIMLALLAPTGSALGAKDKVDTQHLQNPLKAPSTETLEPTRLWKLGGFSESDEELFGVIVDLVSDSSGRVYLLDLQLAEVKVFSAAGEYVRTIGREGDGPGEFRRPRNVFILPNGNLCVVQPSPSRLSIFEPDGRYVGEFDLPGPADGGFQFVSKVRCRGGTFVVEGLTTRLAEGSMDQTSRVIRVDADGSELAEFGHSSRHLEFARVIVREEDTNPLMWTVGPAGRVYITNGFDYVIEVRRPEGSVERVIARDYPHRPRSREEIEEVRGYFERGGGTEGVVIEVMKYDRDVKWLEVADDGRMWLLTSRGSDALPEDTLGAFDIYDDSGRLAKEITLKGEGDPHSDRYYLFGDRFYVVAHYAEAFRSWQARVGRAVSSNGDELEDDEEPEPMGVICYRLPQEVIR